MTAHARDAPHATRCVLCVPRFRALHYAPHFILFCDCAVWDMFAQNWYRCGVLLGRLVTGGRRVTPGNTRTSAVNTAHDLPPPTATYLYHYTPTTYRAHSTAHIPTTRTTNASTSPTYCYPPTTHATCLRARTTARAPRMRLPAHTRCRHAPSRSFAPRLPPHVPRYRAGLCERLVVGPLLRRSRWLRLRTPAPYSARTAALPPHGSYRCRRASALGRFAHNCRPHRRTTPRYLPLLAHHCPATPTPHRHYPPCAPAAAHTLPNTRPALPPTATLRTLPQPVPTLFPAARALRYTLARCNVAAPHSAAHLHTAPCTTRVCSWHFTVGMVLLWFGRWMCVRADEFRGNAFISLRAFAFCCAIVNSCERWDLG